MPTSPFACVPVTLIPIGLLLLTACGGGSSGTTAPPPNDPQAKSLDLAEISTDAGLLRLQGSVGNGEFGVPVAGGLDINGDGFKDFAMASMLASPSSRRAAGQVALVLGDGAINGTLDTGVDNPRILTIIGDGNNENAGSEIWMGDVTGDGLGDLLIARQNYRASAPDRVGAGALSILIGSNELSELARDNQDIDLRQSPPEGVNIITIVGRNALDRLGIWMRTGDITGDGIDDILVGADQADSNEENNSGAVYLIRGGSHLNTAVEIDLNNINDTVLSGHVSLIEPPIGSSGYHLGATVNIADLDANGRSEALLSATINRAGASLLAEGAPAGSAEASGGHPGGLMYIVWDDNFPEGPWPTDSRISLGEATPGSVSRISGGAVANSYTNRFFGEELIGGKDYNGDGNSDLFIGDISGNVASRSSAGLGHIIFNASQLKNLSFDISSPPQGIESTVIFGPEAGAISSDTAAHGDFDNDGIDDLALASPHANPLNRASAGSVHILWGQAIWPATIDLSPLGQQNLTSFIVTDIHGANGTRGNDKGDTLAYSAAAGDIDDDGLTDLIINEMVGNGATDAAIDVGNLIIVSGETIRQEK